MRFFNTVDISRHPLLCHATNIYWYIIAIKCRFIFFVWFANLLIEIVR